MSPSPRKRRSNGQHRILIIVENLPLARDARVRRECEALLEHGYSVSVICRRGDPDERDHVRGVRLYEYPAPPEPSTVLGFAYEFVFSWVASAVLTADAVVLEGIDAMQACNPPDTYFLLALPLKLLGVPFVFDHHDLAPELYAARFGRRDAIYALLKLLERLTFATADHVIATNESFRRIAEQRGKKRRRAITIVRNGPRLDEISGQRACPELKAGKRFLCCWVGTMGSVDDGLDLALKAVAHLVHSLGRRDCQFAFVGDGEARRSVESLCDALRITDFVTFTGWLSRAEMYSYLATADIGLQPDPKNERTDASTAMKTMEYLAFGLPIVAFDVYETRCSAGAAGCYARDNDPTSLAALVHALLDDPDRRADMGAIGRRRVAEELAWDHQKISYVGVFDNLLSNRLSHSARLDQR